MKNLVVFLFAFLFLQDISAQQWVMLSTKDKKWSELARVAGVKLGQAQLKDSKYINMSLKTGTFVDSSGSFVFKVGIASHNCDHVPEIWVYTSNWTKVVEDNSPDALVASAVLSPTTKNPTGLIVAGAVVTIAYVSYGVSEYIDQLLLDFKGAYDVLHKDTPLEIINPDGNRVNLPNEEKPDNVPFIGTVHPQQDWLDHYLKCLQIQAGKKKVLQALGQEERPCLQILQDNRRFLFTDMFGGKRTWSVYQGGLSNEKADSLFREALRREFDKKIPGQPFWYPGIAAFGEGNLWVFTRPYDPAEKYTHYGYDPFVATPIATTVVGESEIAIYLFEAELVPFIRTFGMSFAPFRDHLSQLKDLIEHMLLNRWPSNTFDYGNIFLIGPHMVYFEPFGGHEKVEEDDWDEVTEGIVLPEIFLDPQLSDVYPDWVEYSYLDENGQSTSTFVRYYYRPHADFELELIENVIEEKAPGYLLFLIPSLDTVYSIEGDRTFFLFPVITLGGGFNNSLEAGSSAFNIFFSEKPTLPLELIPDGADVIRVDLGFTHDEFNVSIPPVPGAKPEEHEIFFRYLYLVPTK